MTAEVLYLMLEARLRQVSNVLAPRCSVVDHLRVPPRKGATVPIQNTAALSCWGQRRRQNPAYAGRLVTHLAQPL